MPRLAAVPIVALGLLAARGAPGDIAPALAGPERVERWGRFEAAFESSHLYEDPLHDLERFAVRFVSPTGRLRTVPGFWDGERLFKVRFSPDEEGAWTWETDSSDPSNAGLHGVKGTFECLRSSRPQPIYRRGAIARSRGAYHLSHADGTPFFWAACTAWNGALKSTDEEWEAYLSHRAQAGYTAIQFVATQWRGAAADATGNVAFEGADRIRIRPSFFQRLDAKFDRVNVHGLVAAPVLLWALPTGQGRELSPGYYLPEPEAILLARYMVARYGAHHVVWILGGDGRYVGEYEQRWKTIGRGVFGGEDVRRASYRSLFAAPVAGISYGANGVWPWLRQLGEPILNHRPSPGSSPWHEGIRLPGSVQVGHLARFIQQLPWWTLRPAPELLAEQPGDRVPDEFVSVVKSEDHRTILVYLPGPVRARIRLPLRQPYARRTFDPVAGEYLPGSRTASDPLLDLPSPLPHDAVVVLTAVRDGLRRGPRQSRARRRH